MKLPPPPLVMTCRLQKELLAVASAVVGVEMRILYKECVPGDHKIDVSQHAGCKCEGTKQEKTASIDYLVIILPFIAALEVVVDVSRSSFCGRQGGRTWTRMCPPPPSPLG